MKMKLLIILMLFLCFFQHGLSQTNGKKGIRMDFYYIPWRIYPQWPYTAEEIKTMEEKTYYSTKDTIFIMQLLASIPSYEFIIENNIPLDVRMLIEVYRGDSLSDIILVGQPTFIRNARKWIADSVKIPPPCLRIDDEILIGLFPIQLGDKIYKSNFEFGKLLIEKVPKAKEIY
jgi:hypothetical protein